MTFRLNAPVFLLASERSGGNLTRAIVGAHPDFAAPAPLHFLRHFNPLVPLYGPLEEDANFRRLCADIARFADLQIGGGSLGRDADGLFQGAPERSLMGLFDALYAPGVEAKGAKRFFAKENETLDFVYPLLRAWPDAKFIYLVRDPRDVAVSWARSLNHPGGIGMAARVWAREQRQGGCVLSDPAVRERTFILHYEALLAGPEAMVRDLCAFLGLDFLPAMLDFHKSEEIKAQSQAVDNWRNLAKPIDSANSGKFLKALSRGQIRQIEAIAFEEMVMFGYTPMAAKAAARPGVLRTRLLAAARRLYKLAYGARFKKGEFAQRRQRLLAMEALKGGASAAQTPRFTPADRS